MKVKPMLAEKAPDIHEIEYPVLASPKLDGIRCLIKDGRALSRRFKPFPNKFVQYTYGREYYEGLDGELIVGAPNDQKCMSNTTSGVMSIEGEPSVRFFVFDCWDREDYPFRRVVQDLHNEFYCDDKIYVVSQTLINNAEEMEAYEKDWVGDLGYEGVVIRDPNGPYKFGRSTKKQGWMLKVKRFQDDEARIVGFVEATHNANEAKTNAIGHTERSFAKAGMIGKGTLGSFECTNSTWESFNVGPGCLTHDERQEIWNNREKYQDKIITFKYFGHGIKDLPRHSGFKAFRHQDDMS